MNFFSFFLGLLAGIAAGPTIIHDVIGLQSTNLIGIICEIIEIIKGVL